MQAKEGSKRSSPRAWFSKLKEFLLMFHFVLAKSNGLLFIQNSTNVCLYVLVYVDDLIVIGNHQRSIDEFVTTLDAKFSLKDLRPLSYLLGIKVLPTTEGLFLSQQNYVYDMLKMLRWIKPKAHLHLWLLPPHCLDMLAALWKISLTRGTL